MERTVNGKTIVVSGAADGIGYEIVANFLLKGAKLVIILDINQERGFKTEKILNEKYGDGKAVFIKCDVISDLESVTKRIFNEFNQVDVLVNNAGIADETSYLKTIEINLIAVIAWTEKFYEYMRKDKGGNGGTIMNISSIYGYRIIPYAPFYNATKFGVMGYSKSLGHSHNFEKTSVRVLTICPGVTKTNLVSSCKLRDIDVLTLFADDSYQKDWQNSDVVGREIVEVFQKADSGSSWVIERSLPAEEI
ncbi:unnamed protein product [Parnassius apollo]|uniref:(apollo) hypothetical protein n=1 Tax=Parnassius apollo TaxID=110799 RepID=A0A8S3XR52_PARAO|nr:unnamed protein product [Parnassius apollo]